MLLLLSTFSSVYSAAAECVSAVVSGTNSSFSYDDERVVRPIRSREGDSVHGRPRSRRSYRTLSLERKVKKRESYVCFESAGMSAPSARRTAFWS